MPLDISQRWFAWAMPRLAQHYDNLLADRKRALLSVVGGTIVELGPGTGTNFRYYPPGAHWIGIEPNPYLHPHLHRAGEEARLRVDIRQGYAEHIDLADGSADVVVATAVLCSVTDQIQSLREIRRVLKSGGRFVFLEHVAAGRGTSLRRVQRVVQPFWGCIADGCNPVRDTGEAIAGAEAVVDGTRKEFMESVATVPLLIIDDFGMRKLPLTAAEDLLEIIMRRYERVSTLLTSNRPVEDWGKLLGDVAAVTSMLDRILHHGHVLKCGPRSWRTKAAVTTAGGTQ